MDEVLKLKKENDALRKLAYEDELTGLLNRRGLRLFFAPLFDSARFLMGKEELRRVRIDDVSVLFIDLDGFKPINDMYGHEVGDRVLKDVARILRENVRGVDGVARVGGDEFVVVLLGAHGDEASTKAESILQKIKTLDVGEGLSLGASIGVASLVETKAEKFEELITYADTAMYTAKQKQGKNTVTYHTEVT